MLGVSMVFTITYPPECAADEIATLKRFESVILNNWVEHSCSMADLAWQLVVEDREPRRYAVLATRTAIPHKLHRESFFSLTKKQQEAFRDEFVRSALAYSSTTPIH
jgi:hypothetical protein